MPAQPIRRNFESGKGGAMADKLTKSKVDKATFDPDGKPKQITWDSRIPGFGVRVYSGGRKSYVLRYGPRGRERLMVLGPATGAGLAEYRDHASELLRKFRNEGADPLAEKHKAAAGTVAAVVEAYIDASDWSEAETKRAKSRLKNHMAKIAAIPLERLSRREARQMHREVTKRAPYEANRVLQLLRAAINHALSEGGWRAQDLAEGENPATRVKLNKEKSRKEWIQPDEIPAVVAAINAEDNPWFRAYFKAMLFTGGRPGELRTLQWEKVNLKRKVVTFTDTKNGEDHDVPLSPEAVELFKSIPKTLGNAYVFCGHVTGRPIVNPYKPWERILERAGIDRRVTPHDIRRTVGSLLATKGWSTQQIGKLLNHKSPITAKVYAEIADQAKADMTGEIGRLLA
jgi:integrase